MKCTIEWNSLPLPEWENRFARIRRATLLQSYDYARAACAVHHQKARWGLIRIDGAEAGLVQILEAGVFGNTLHGMWLDCGPLWLPGYGRPEHVDEFFAEFARAFPRRIGRRRRMIPEIKEGSPAAASLEKHGFRRLPCPGYRTIWIDLTLPEEALLAQLKAPWRNKLGKAQNHGVTVVWDLEGKTLPWLLTKYQSDRVKKEYEGPSAGLLRQMAKVFVPKGRFLIGRAFLDNQAIAGILVLCHGTSATYQIGWSAREGRKAAAHNILLWQAVLWLKDKGFHDFDLGGVNDQAQGLTKFKEGMGGEAVTGIGHYI